MNLTGRATESQTEYKGMWLSYNALRGDLREGIAGSRGLVQGRVEMFANALVDIQNTC